MTKPKLYIMVVPQIIKDLVNTLLNCKATFEIDSSKYWLTIYDISAFNFDGMYRIQVTTENNTKDIFIAAENMKEFTVHFR